MAVAKVDKPFIRYFHAGAFPIYIAIAFNKLDFNKEMKRIGLKNPPEFLVPGYDGATHVIGTDVKATTCIVCVDIKKGTTEEQAVGLLIHEAVHCWQETKKAINEKEPSIEFEAYTIQYYSQCFITEFKRYKKALRAK